MISLPPICPSYAAPVDAEASTELIGLQNENFHLKTEVEILRHQLELWEKAEQEWTEKRRVYHIMTNQITDMIALLDRTGSRTWSNHAWTRLLGYTPEELQHRSFLDHIHSDEQAQFLQLFARVIDSGKSERFEHRLNKVDGSWIQVESEVSPVTDEQNYIDCLILICRDITDRRLAEEEKIAGRATESVAQLASEVASEYQEFLTYVTANLTMAKNVNGPHNAVAVRLNEIERALRRVGDVTDRLLALTPKLVNPDKEKKLQSIESIIRNVVSMTLRASACRAEFQFPSDMPEVEVCADSLGHAIRNVVKNASEALPKGGVIRISGQVLDPAYFCQRVVPGVEPGHYLTISFQDNGPGMSEAILSRAVEPYFSTKSGAQGLGLSSTQNILLQHKGALRLQSVTGVGTTVIFYLPMQAQSNTVIKSSDPMIRDRKLRALLMDDEEMIIDIVSRMLDHLGFEVVATRDGNQAIAAFTKAKFTKNYFDIALLDLVIPRGLSGADAVHTIRQISPSTPVIACSGHFDHPAMTNYQNHGFSTILYKPYQLEKLQTVIDAALNLKKIGT